MKRKTCNILIGSGIAWLTMAFLTSLVAVPTYAIISELRHRGGFYIEFGDPLISTVLAILFFFLMFGFPGLILLIIGLVKWK